MLIFVYVQFVQDVQIFNKLFKIGLEMKIKMLNPLKKKLKISCPICMDEIKLETHSIPTFLC